MRPIAKSHQTITWTNDNQVYKRHMVSTGHNKLTHWDLVMHACIDELNQYWLVANWIFRNKMPRGFKQNRKIFKKYIANVACNFV